MTRGSLGFRGMSCAQGALPYTSGRAGLLHSRASSRNHCSSKRWIPADHLTPASHSDPSSWLQCEYRGAGQERTSPERRGNPPGIRKRKAGTNQLLLSSPRMERIDAEVGLSLHFARVAWLIPNCAHRGSTF